jgi:hypothetical protein
MTRYFRTADPDLYEATRLGLDAAWGLPNDRGTVTCIPPLPIAQRDANGRVLLVVDAEWCEWPEVASMLPGLLASGAVEEITAADYEAALPSE